VKQPEGAAAEWFFETGPVRVHEASAQRSAFDAVTTTDVAAGEALSPPTDGGVTRESVVAGAAVV
jgi:hypothetical protein